LGSDERKTGKFRKIYRWILFLATIAGVGYFIGKNINQLSRHSFSLNYLLIFVSLASVVLAYILRFLLWQYLTSIIGLEASLLESARGYFLSILGRYIPGKLGLALIRIEAYKNYPTDMIVMATGIELISALTSAMILAFVGLLNPVIKIPTYFRIIPFAGIVALLFLLSPKVFDRISGKILAFIYKKSPEMNIPYPKRMILALLYTIPGLFHGLGLFLIINSFTHLPLTAYITITGIYYGASLIGLVAFFAPGGLGVREGILFILLPILVSTEIAIIATLLMRIITIFAELILGGTFTVLYNFSREKRV